MAYVNPRVASFSQYLMSDDQPRRLDGYALRRLRDRPALSDGKAKPAYEAFRLPLAVEPYGAHDVLWGRVRPQRGADPGDDRVPAPAGKAWRVAEDADHDDHAASTGCATSTTRARYRVQLDRARRRGVHRRPPCGAPSSRVLARRVRVVSRYGRPRSLRCCLACGSGGHGGRVLGQHVIDGDGRAGRPRSSTPIPSTAARSRWWSCGSTARSAASGCCAVEDLLSDALRAARRSTPSGRSRTRPTVTERSPRGRGSVSRAQPLALRGTGRTFAAAYAPRRWRGSSGSCGTARPCRTTPSPTPSAS